MVSNEELLNVPVNVPPVALILPAIAFLKLLIEQYGFRVRVISPPAALSWS